ncbi:MAG: DNA repair protein RadC [Alphaproteobacteria bacterium]|nr:DNA repair protein RadC [Alphaproteobacteria bacterium]
MTTSCDSVEEKPSYYGHRARLKERFMVDEGASMPDYELLELLLTMAIPRRDVKELAKKLIKTYGDIGHVLHTPAHELMDRCGLSVNPTVLLKLVSTCALRSSHNVFHDYEDKPLITYTEQLKDYCWQMLAYKEIEEFHVFLFNSDLYYLGQKQISMGTINSASVHPREVIRAALEKHATRVILVHNHPSGNSSPSQQDKKTTKDIEALAKEMEIEIYDHLIVGKEDVFSFRNSGLIVPKKKKDDIPSV